MGPVAAVGRRGSDTLIDLLHLRLRFSTLSSGRLPEYPGDVWRSALGLHLRRQVCITGAATCAGCPLRQTCTYGYVMETAPPTGTPLLHTSSDVPHPYVLAPQSGGPSESGADRIVDLLLFGKGVKHVAPMIAALVAAGEGGIGADRQKMRLESVEQCGANGQSTAIDRHALPVSFQIASPPIPHRVTVHLESPLRLRVRDHELRPQTFAFRPFFSAILRRSTQLATIHGEASVEAGDVDFAALMQCAESVALHDAALVWHEQRRWSSRQKREMPTGGLLGHFTLQGDLAPLWPWLWQGQWLHVGKGTVMGLGRYRLEIERAPLRWLVSRHPGAAEFLRHTGQLFDRVVPHLDVALLRPGDTVIGTLPLHLAAAVCACGARFFHLALDVPAELRGKELDAQQLAACGARIQEFRIERVTPSPDRN